MASQMDEEVLEQLEWIHAGKDVVNVLRKIKNSIAGRELRKRQYIQHGLLCKIEALLGQDRAKAVRHKDRSVDARQQVGIQCANIICVLANAGPCFVHPILHSSIVANLVSRLSVERSSSISLDILKSLNAIADNLPLTGTDTWTVDKRLADKLYTHSNGRIFAQLILEISHTVSSQQICDEVAALICKTCSTERHKLTLVRAGVLSALCRRLASFVATEGLVIPSKHSKDPDAFLSALVQEFPFPSAHISPILETISVLVESSKDFAMQLLSDTSILSVLPAETDAFPSFKAPNLPWGGASHSAITTHSSYLSTPLDLLLPRVPELEKPDTKDKSSFPPLGSVTSGTRRRPSSTRAAVEAPALTTVDSRPDDPEDHMLIPWLLYMIRTKSGKVRLNASRLLVLLHSEGLVRHSRAQSFGSLLIPILIRMLEDPITSVSGDSILLSGMHYTKLVPFVLSQLLHDDPDKQRIAVDAKAIPKLATALKTTFESNNELQTRLWRPLIQDPTPSYSSPLCSLGLGGPLLSTRHIMAFREGLLRALAAIAPSDDNYRKEICDQGVLAQIILALEPFQTQISDLQPTEPTLSTTGNSTNTLLAACNTVRALTRSVTALRTRLVDADVGKAIIKLMHNSDPEVRIAATKVIANLVMDFSPLKTTIDEPDLIKKLCEQAHSANARLRLESIWALKSLVLNGSNKLKREVIDELGSNWIKHLIETDPYNIPPGIVVGLSEREYPPRTSRHLRRHTDDIVMAEDSAGEHSMTDSSAENSESAMDYNKHTVEDDLAIQEQLIDLIRNLFCGQTASEIVEYLLGEIGEDIFMNILIDRLRPRTAGASSRYQSQSTIAQNQTVIKVLYVIVHIAACAPKFRNMISTNTSLMKIVAGFCTNMEPKIRVQCCWVVINLTYEDDASDREACRRRVLEMYKLGFGNYMRRLESDPEPDVRERAKTAVHLLDKFA